MKRLLLFLNIFFCYTYLSAQTDSITFYPVNNPFLQQYNFQKIIVTKAGKLWLSFGDDLISYDGNDIQTFEGTKLNGSSTFIIKSDKKGNLYIAESLGIHYLDVKTPKKHFLINIERKLNYMPIGYLDIFPDNDSSIWVGTTIGLFHYNLLTTKTDYYPFYTHGNKNAIAVKYIQGDKKDNDIVWLATDNGIISFNKKTHNFYQNFSCLNSSDSTVFDKNILKIHVYSEDIIWFTTVVRGVGCYNIKTGKYAIYSYKQNNLSDEPGGINLIFFQPKNKDEYYVGSTDRCPGLFNIQTHEYSFNTRVFKKLPSLSINDFVSDNKGNLWCIISGQLYHADARTDKFSTVFIKDSNLKSTRKNIFKTVIWDAKQKHYLAAFDNSDGIFVLDSTMKLIKTIPFETPASETEPDTYDIALDKNGDLWACGSFLRIYDSKKQRMVPAEKLFPKLAFAKQSFQNIVPRNDYLFLQPSNIAYKAIYRINLTSHTYDSIPIPYELIPLIDSNGWNRKFHQEVAVIDREGRYAYIGIDNSIVQLDLLTKKARKMLRVAIRDDWYSKNVFWYMLDDYGHLWVVSSERIKVIEPSGLQILKKINYNSKWHRFGMYNATGLGVMCMINSAGVFLYDYKNNKQFHLSISNGLLTLSNSGIACVNNMLFVGTALESLQFLPLNSIINSQANRECYLSGIQIFNQPYTTDTLPEYLHSLQLPHDKNFITLTFSSLEFNKPEQLEYRYKLNGVDEDWVYTNYLKRTISYADLKPGNYIFYTSIKNADGNWNDSKQNLRITIIPAWWQTNWFKILCFIAVSILGILLIRWRISSVRKQEQKKAKTERELLEFEAKALRAQMNPHFIFNCMNSIKSLIQKNEQDKAVNYLTTFSKLIRTIFQNSDKREITLYDEIETCKLYTQLERMRLGNKFTYQFNIDENIDLKSVMVPALIIQPFIENAIWHGVMPKKNTGMVTITVENKNNIIQCIIDDDGIGRELSGRNKFKAEYASHESKGVCLTQARLDLSNLLNEHNTYVEINDKKDKDGQSLGTTVIIEFEES